MNVPVRTIVICATLLLITTIGGCISADTLVRIKAFEAGYCQDTVKGNSMPRWTLCAEHVGD